MSKITTSSVAFFDKELAASYDERFSVLQPMKDALHLLTAGVLAELPEDARILCVGAGTGAEVLALAARFPGWRFTAVEPSGPMLEVCRMKLEAAGLSERCVYHEGYLDSLPESPPFHAATSFLVSQFILDGERRRDFFRGIASRLEPEGWLVSVDLSADMASEDYGAITGLWARLFGMAGILPEQIANLLTAYGRDVAVSPPEQVEGLIASAGFGKPVAFLQTALIRGWFARRPGQSHLENIQPRMDANGRQ